MKRQLKRLTALILVLSMTMSLLCGTAWAEELTEETTDSAEASTVEAEDEPTEDVADELEVEPESQPAVDVAEESEAQTDEAEPTEETEAQADEAEPAEESEGEDVVQTLEAEVLYSDTCGENLTWTLDDAGLLTISGSGAMRNYDQGETPWYDCGVKKIIIKENVTSIGDWAFSECESLTSITIPNSVISIGEGAFFECKSLTSITIPNSVTSIGENAFSYCNKLTSIAVDSKNSIYSSKSGVLYNKKQTVLICHPAGKAGAFTIPNSVISIGDWAFEDCKSLTSITIPKNVTSIGNSAFRSCSSLTSITIPDGVTSIGEDAFYNCSSLTSVTIPNSVTSIGNGAFCVCKSLTSITIPNSVTSIGEWAFEECSSLTRITIPNSMTSISNGTFYGCNALTSVTIPNSVTSIGGYAFEDCQNLTSITIPNSVISIGDYAFENCKSLTSVTIPKSVTSIGNWAFANCDSLKDVYYAGSKSDWSKIRIDDACLEGATIHYNSFSPTKTALSKATVTLSKTKVAYTGKAQKPTVTVKVDGVTVPSSQYTVSYSNNTKVGTAKVTIKATSKATYISGSVTKTFTITKAANPLTVSPTSKSFTVANCKKKAQTFTIKASKAQGTVSYKSSNTKYVTVSKGKVTVKKGTPKGTYKVTVTAKGNGSYNSGSKTVTITVK